MWKLCTTKQTRNRIATPQYIHQTSCGNSRKIQQARFVLEMHVEKKIEKRAPLENWQAIELNELVSGYMYLLYVGYCVYNVLQFEPTRNMVPTHLVHCKDI